MIDSTSVLFGLEDEFAVTSLERLSSSDLRVVIEQRDREAPCPACGVLTTRVKDRPLVRIKGSSYLRVVHGLFDFPRGGAVVTLRLVVLG